MKKAESVVTDLKAVILAGGLGKRLGSVNDNIPKPMTLIYGRPVLEHQIEALKKEGIKEFIFVVGHLYEKIEEYFKDGKHLDVNISYFREREPLGTAGALFKLKFTDDFLLCNGDLIFNFNLKKMVDFHRKNNALATLFTHPNSHPYDSTLVCTDESHCINDFLSVENKPESYQNLCNAGVEIISPELLKMYTVNGAADLDRDVIMPAVKTGRIYSYKSFEYVRDMGTPDRLKSVENDVKSGLVERRYSSVLQKAVFLDRDGTVNKLRGFITEPSEIELLDGVGEAVKRLNTLGYLVIIITNQPVIARGECTEEKLKEIHNRLETLLGENAAYLDGIYYCPHHPDKGFENEVKELKIQCNCRKPSPGLLLRAKEDFNIDLAASFMVGDTMRDVQAAQNAGCIPILLTGEENEAFEKDINTFKSLLDFSKHLQEIQR